MTVLQGVTLLGVSGADLALLAGSLVAAGLLTGFLAGLFGIGGGAITVPLLYEVLRLIDVDADLRMHIAIGTSLAIIVPTSLRSFLSHKAKGAVDMSFLRRVAPWVVVGVVLGSALASVLPSAALKWVWALLGTSLAIKLALGRDNWRLGDEIPRHWWVEGYAILVGLFSTLMSVGGTAFMISMMTLYGRPLLGSLATCAGLGPLISVPGAVGFIWAGWGAAGLPPISLGYVNVLALLLVVPASVLAAPFGVRLAHGIGKRALEIGFACLLGLVSLRFILSLLA